MECCKTKMMAVFGGTRWRGTRRRLRSIGQGAVDRRQSIAPVATINAPFPRRPVVVFFFFFRKRSKRAYPPPPPSLSSCPPFPTRSMDLWVERPLQINAAAEVIYSNVDPTANIIFGALVDERMEGEMSITVLATGFQTQVSGSCASPPWKTLHQ